MSFNDILSIVTTAIVAVGGAGTIIIAISGWLGKLWAEKLMNADKARHEAELARLRSDLDKSNQVEVERIRTELAFLKEHRLRDASDKVVIYRTFIDLISEFLAKFENAIENGSKLSGVQLTEFNRQRIRIYAYLALTAPQEVMDAHDKLIDHILNVAAGQFEYSWSTVRTFAIAMINECRKDIGLNTTSISYNGDL
jgi:hypothetical protein